MHWNKITIFLFLTLPFSLWGQRDSSNINPIIEYGARAGMIVPHSEATRPLSKNSDYFANELRVGIQTQGDKDWHIIHNYPTYGVGLYWGTFNNASIGKPIATFGYATLPHLNKRKHYLGTYWALGMGFNFEPYHPISNTTNAAISTKRNAYAAAGLEWSYQLSEHWDIGLGLKAEHFSNGNVRKPNDAINMASIELSTAYRINGNPQIKEQTVKVEDTNLEYSLMYAGGFAAISRSLDKLYYCSVISGAIHKRIYKRRSFGGGLDIFYSSYLDMDPETYRPMEVSLSQLMSYAVYGSSEFIFGDLLVAAQLGFYLWTPDNFTDLPYYERLALRYYLFNEQAFVNLSVKAHHERALYTEWGIGINLF